MILLYNLIFCFNTLCGNYFLTENNNLDNIIRNEEAKISLKDDEQFKNKMEI